MRSGWLLPAVSPLRTRRGRGARPALAGEARVALLRLRGLGLLLMVDLA